ncbi:hemolysin III family protein [Mesorhizobium sp.]|uniref:PAQR family membrane homeostasis protein TrhA n=1 Tax=Mesorhizobium sp. TaxID=1871066 RepID=UPI00121C20A3|nr:hemolysin III family protein [Mesorhizobium sp.]TIO09798.1 MAG: hemolysin III family protein [Mesorhizobium sp.]TIO34290.1 MAG: hemolysin III family protein [Mesorhizobium sp.]TIP11986.1 MAG: hemolysin III family protein [Mesorhizobium sp.]
MTNIRPESLIEIPFMGRWHYSRAEMIADGIVHAVGIVLAIAAGSALLALAAPHAGPGEYVAAAFYVVSLLTVLSVSLAYNLWPVSPAKWILRRFDHAAIYLLIAATYTPFLAQLDGSPLAVSMIVLVWVAAAIGIAIKVLLPGRFDRLAIVFYLAIGWSGIVLVEPLVQTLPTTSIALIVAGGIVYSCGVIFFAWKGLRFHNALWHGFVVTGASLHLAAMVDCLVINRL